MPLLVGLAGASVLVISMIVFGALMYRIAGVRPGPLERRRLSLLVLGLGAMLTVLVVAFAMDAPGAEFYGLGVAAVGYIGVRALQQRGHWLATPTPQEQAELPARRAAFAATRGKLLLLAALFLLTVPLTALAVVLLLRSPP